MAKYSPSGVKDVMRDLSFSFAMTEKSEFSRMPKDRKAPSLSIDQTKASPYHCSARITEQNRSENFVESTGDKNEWEEAVCPICMEHPHNAVLLLENQWGIVIKPARRFMNAKPRSCSHETCEFSGSYSALENHARLVHPLVRPSKAEPIRQQNWTELERERQTQDLLSASQRGWEEERSFGDTEIEVSIVYVERSSPVNSLPETTVSGGSGVGGGSRRFRTTARMRVGNGPTHQLASRTGGYPPRQTQNSNA
ncbi:hypothetical protein Acr_16g0007230 [Actinidia rufa]|uniref:Uncharacterized protein n=1 Tax=Actinidia rufa TaxID=165716 RepID=A0A7J0FZH7_9ERIC|nr:hypothetical protein Acr_16g0007230 [Actinidia rufa]